MPRFHMSTRHTRNYKIKYIHMPRFNMTYHGTYLTKPVHIVIAQTIGAYAGPWWSTWQNCNY